MSGQVPARGWMHDLKGKFPVPGSEHIFCISNAINMWWGGRVGTQAWEGRPGLPVMSLCSDPTQKAYLLVREENWLVSCLCLCLVQDARIDLG